MGGVRCAVRRGYNFCAWHHVVVVVVVVVVDCNVLYCLWRVLPVAQLYLTNMERNSVAQAISESFSKVPERVFKKQT